MARKKPKTEWPENLDLTDVIERFENAGTGTLEVERDLSKDIAHSLFDQLRDAKGLKVRDIWDASYNLAEQLRRLYLIINKEGYRKG